MERTLVAFTITLLAHAPAHAAHPIIQAAGTARPGEFVATRENPSGYVFARQVIQATQAAGSPRANSRVIYLNRDGAVLSPGINDSRTDTSSIVAAPTLITPWDIDDDTWDATVSCVRDIYARFDVTITDRDPGDAPHIEAVFGGHPYDVGFDQDNIAGVSPFTTDCGIIENSIVFTFTDVLPDDPRIMCEVMAQEIAHSYGLDHEMLPSDPMTYLEYTGDRSFKDQMASCGEFGDRMCGIGGSVCRQRQNSVQLLEQRLGRRGSGAPDDATENSPTTTEPEGGGCSSSGSRGGPFLVIALYGLVRRRRR